MTDLTAQQLAEENADKVRASDDRAREAAGKPHPVEGHDVRENHPELYNEDGTPKLPEES